MADNKVNSGLLEFSEDQKVFVALDAETSEVQKAVTIDGDGVETNIQGVQPSGKKEITTTAEVNVASYATAQVVDEDLVAGNIKKDVDILGVVGSYEPETPASDFEVVEITITRNQTEANNVTFALEGAVIVTDILDPNDNYIKGCKSPEMTLSSGIPRESFNIILYKGIQSIFIETTATITGHDVSNTEAEQTVNGWYVDVTKSGSIYLKNV